MGLAFFLLKIVWVPDTVIEADSWLVVSLYANNRVSECELFNSNTCMCWRWLLSRNRFAALVSIVHNIRCWISPRLEKWRSKNQKAYCVDDVEGCVEVERIRFFSRCGNSWSETQSLLNLLTFLSGSLKRDFIRDDGRYFHFYARYMEVWHRLQWLRNYFHSERQELDRCQVRIRLLSLERLLCKENILTSLMG